MGGWVGGWVRWVKEKRRCLNELMCCLFWWGGGGGGGSYRQTRMHGLGGRVVYTLNLRESLFISEVWPLPMCTTKSEGLSLPSSFEGLLISSAELIASTELRLVGSESCWVGGWVVEMMEEIEAVRMSYCTLGVGGWVDGGD